MLPRAWQRRLRKELDRAWRDLETQVSATCGCKIRIVPAVRRDVERDHLHDFDTELEDVLRLDREGKTQAAREAFTEVVRGFRGLAEPSARHISLQIAGTKQPRPRAQRASKASGLHGQARRGPYRSAFNRRLAILEHVGNDYFGVDNIINRTTDVGRIWWPAAASGWNAGHPDDRLTPETLRRTYYRARADEDLLDTYFDQQQQGVWEASGTFARAVGAEPVETAGIRPVACRRESRELVVHTAAGLTRSIPLKGWGGNSTAKTRRKAKGKADESPAVGRRDSRSNARI